MAFRAGENGSLLRSNDEVSLSLRFMAVYRCSAKSIMVIRPPILNGLTIAKLGAYPISPEPYP